MAQPDKNIHRIAIYYLNRWLVTFNRSYTQPTNDQIDRINNILNLHFELVGEKRKQLIEFNMKAV